MISGGRYYATPNGISVFELTIQTEDYAAQEESGWGEERNGAAASRFGEVEPVDHCNPLQNNSQIT
jgi:hypothetical protein